MGIKACIMNCIVVDDDATSRLTVEHCVKKHPSLELLASFPSGQEAIKFIRQNAVDLIFLDIEMPDMSGMEFVSSYADLPQVIFVTSNKDYAADAFNYDVTDYIVKPVDFSRFEEAVEKAEQINASFTSAGENDELLFVKSGTVYYRLDLDDILFVEALGDYVNLHTEKKKYTILSTMKTLEKKLPSSKFIRIHRSHIVALGHVDQIEDNTVVVNGKLLSVSRHYKEYFMKRLNLL